VSLAFGQKIALGISCLVGITVAAALSVSGAWVTHAVRAKIDRDLAAADQTVAEVLRIRSGELSAKTSMLLADAPLRDAVIADTADPEQAGAIARAAGRLVGSDLLMLVDDHARLLASATHAERRGENMAGNAAIADALAGRTFEGLLGADDGIYQVVAVPVRDGDRVAGAIVAGFAVGDTLLANLEDMTNSLVALWSPSVAEVSNRARPVFGDIAGRIVVTPGRATRLETSAGPYVVRVGEIGRSGISYALARSMDVELAFFRELRQRLLAGAALLLAAALAAGFVYSRRVTRPIEALVEGTERLAAGDLSARVEIRSRDELGRLAGAFNQMAGEIQDLVEEERHLAADAAALSEKLAALNSDLQVQIAERRQAETEVKRLNEDLEARVAARTAELEAANRQLESFSYSVSHDLRGPLQRISGFSEIVLAEAGPRLDEDQRRSLERIRASALTMGGLIEKLLEFAHVGRCPLDRRVVDVSTLARGIAEDLASSDPSRSASFVIADELVARGDGDLVGVALQNLMSNAWKFTSHSPRARIELGVEAGNGDGPTFFVRDNGAGFETAEAHKLFRVFERLHSAREFEGHGIGLAIVKRIVEHHGGRVWASGSPGAGSTFRFTLGA
jgi:signal transduction histidine kinase